MARDNRAGRVALRDIALVRVFVVGREDTVFFTALRAVVFFVVRVLFVAARDVVARDTFVFWVFEVCRADVVFVSVRVRAFCVRVAPPAIPAQKHNPRKIDNIFLIPSSLLFNNNIKNTIF